MFLGFRAVLQPPHVNSKNELTCRAGIVGLRPPIVIAYRTTPLRIHHLPNRFAYAYQTCQSTAHEKPQSHGGPYIDSVHELFSTSGMPPLISGFVFRE